jgi:hypothetical protein
MAPERFDGETLPQSDLYSLGLTLYELLTLKPAFDDASKTRLIDRILHEEPSPLRSHDRTIPHDLETIVLKCIAKDPLQRYRSASELADDLRRFLADEPIKARRESWLESAWRWLRRNPAVATLSALVLVLLVVLAVQLTGKPKRPIEPGSTAETALPDPGQLSAYRDRVGATFYFRVTGRFMGTIWGTGIYTDDSSLASAVVHAGLLKPGEKGVVKVTVLPGQPSYEGSLRNGIPSNQYGRFGGSYRVELVGNPTVGKPLHPDAKPDPGSLVTFRTEVGKTLLFEVLGHLEGTVYGTDTYTDDSNLATAAVHSGMLRPGERGVLHVKILPAQADYRGSTRHGVSSLDWPMLWQGSFRLERVER